jgi:hypothetical protein
MSVKDFIGHASIVINFYHEEVLRYHPILYSAKPMASETPRFGELCRHKSTSHHTEGFATIEEAVADIEAKGLSPTFYFVEWDGTGVPADIAFLPFMKAIKDPRV